MIRRLAVLLPLTLVWACGGGGDEGGGGAPDPLESAALDFGSVVVGDRVARTLVIRNPTAGTYTVITAITVSDTGFTPGAGFPALPFDLPAGTTLAFTVFADPATVGAGNATVGVVHGAGTLDVALTANAVASEQVLDLGSQPLSGAARETAELSVVVPDQAVALMIEAFGATANGGPVFLSQLTGPGTRVYVDRADPHGGPYRFDRNFPSNFFALPVLPLHDTRFVVPNSDDPALQLVPGGGTYRFRVSNQGGTLNAINVRVHLELRSTPAVVLGHVDLNVFLAAGLPVSVAQAPTNVPLQQALGEAQLLLAQIGLDFGNVTYRKLASPAFDTRTGNDTGPLFALSAGADGNAVNVFFVVDIPFGVAGAIPGSKRHGTALSGIVVPFPGVFPPASIGATVAHELSHYLGLGHTFENPGLPWTHDRLLDTTECPVAGCDNNLMDGTFVGSLLTAGQARVLLRHPLVRPGAGDFVAGATLTGIRTGPDLPCASCR